MANMVLNPLWQRHCGCRRRKFCYTDGGSLPAQAVPTLQTTHSPGAVAEFPPALAGVDADVTKSDVGTTSARSESAGTLHSPPKSPPWGPHVRIEDPPARETFKTADATTNIADGGAVTVPPILQENCLKQMIEAMYETSATIRSLRTARKCTEVVKEAAVTFSDQVGTRFWFL